VLAALVFSAREAFAQLGQKKLLTLLVILPGGSKGLAQLNLRGNIVCIDTFES